MVKSVFSQVHGSVSFTVKIEYFCTFTRVKLKKQYFYFYWSNILLYVSILLLKYLICVLIIFYELNASF